MRLGNELIRFAHGTKKPLIWLTNIKQMGYLKINVDDGEKEFVEQLLQKLGFEVTEEPEQNPKPAPQKNKVSPTMLFGAWKDVDIDPTNYRKKLWERKS